jgi:4-amino-4-deoxy-L-arabinose transferase-like glycosyltransferase
MMDQPAAFHQDEKQPFSAPQLLAASLLTAIFAQAFLIQSYKVPEFFWEIQNWVSRPTEASPVPGLILYILAAWLFIRALVLMGDTSSQPNLSTAISQESAPPRFGFWITCLGMAAVLALLMTDPLIDSAGWLLAATWLINIGLLIISTSLVIRWQAPAIETIAAWFRAHRWEISGIVVIIAAAFMLRFWNIEFHPYAFINDEGEIGNAALCIQTGECTNLFDTWWAEQPVLAFVPTLISITMLGHTVIAVRLVSVIIGTLAVLAVYFFTREVFGQKQAWLAAILLAILPVHVHFSRLGVDNIMDSLSTTAVLACLFFGLKRGSTLGFLAAGILGGLFMYTYPGSRLAFILGMATLGYVAVKTPAVLKAQAFNFVIFIFSFIVTVAPLVGYYLTNPGVFLARMEAETVFKSDVTNAASLEGIQVLFMQFMKSSLVFILSAAPTNFFNSPRPYLTPLAAIFFVLGLAYTIWRIREARYFILFIWFWAAIVLGSTITGGPPTSQRMLMSTPALAVIVAIGLCKVTENIPKTFLSMSPNRVQGLCLIIFICWVGYKDISYYHYEYRVGHYFEDPTEEFTYETAAAVSQLHGNGDLYLLVNPQVDYLSFANFSYFSPDVKKGYLFEVSPESLGSLPKDRDALFIALPDHLEDLKKIVVLLPGGEWNEIQRRFQPLYVLYYSYKLKQSNLQAVNQ